MLPYDLAFQDPAFEAQHFPAIRDEIQRRAIEARDAQQFLQLQHVGAILRTALVESDETAAAQFGPLLFQAYQYWQQDKPLYQLDEALFRHLVGQLVPIGAWSLQPPAPAGYLQFPRNLLWARIDEDATPEAVDGLFWSVGAAAQTLEVLLVLGLVAGRPGFSIAEVSATTEPGLGHWGDVQMRAQGTEDFANILPGGELQRLHALQTSGEVLKLVSRVFWYIAQHADALQLHGPAHTLVRLGQAGDG